MRASILEHLQAKVSPEAIRQLYTPPAPRDYTAEALNWFGKLDSRIKWLVLVLVVWFGVWALFTGPEW